MYPAAALRLLLLGRSLRTLAPGFIYDLDEMRRLGFRIVGVFDASSEKVGMRVGDIAVQSMDELPGAVEQTGSRIAILCVPPDQAQKVADQAVTAGIRGLLNFAPASITVPPHVVENSVDLAIRLEQLSFQLRSAAEKM